MITVSKSGFRHLIVADENPDTSYLDQDGFEDRKLAYKHGEFDFVGIRAVVTISVGHVSQYINSPGLWGIESDSGEEFFDEVFKEESNSLVDILKELGVEVVE